MKNNRAIPFIFGFILFMLLISKGLAFEKKMHEYINIDIARRTINEFSLNNYLLNDLGFKGGVGEPLYGFSEISKTKKEVRKEVWNWIGEGGIKEDEPESIPRYISNLARNNNHFHNPLADTWSSAGFDLDIPLPNYPYHYHVKGQSSILWAHNKNQKLGGNWSWHDARRHYYEGLTSTDWKKKEKSLASCFRALGQLMHLVQDASVPAHTRNEAHLVPFHYEPWIEKIRQEEPGRFNNFISNPPLFDESILNGSPNPLPSIQDIELTPIAKIVDTDQYRRGDNPDSTLNKAVGLAEYANPNFFGEVSLLLHPNGSADRPYPTINGAEEAFWLIPDPRDNHKEVTRKYYFRKIGEHSGYRLATVGFLKDYITTHFPFYSNRLKPALDGGVYNDYAEQLLPRAVSYSAEVLKFFFRGKLQVTSLPIFYRNGIQFVRVNIKNMTPNETMENGYFVLTYRYTPTGKKTDGSEDIFGIAWYNSTTSIAPCDKLEYGKDMTIDFIIDPTIPRENLSSVKLTLAYRGTLGNEKVNEDGTGGAVIGKVFTLGEIKFEEEWDNGLTGNHNWAHTDFSTSQDYQHGTSSNIIEGDTLIKENIRFAGFKNAKANGSFIGVEPLYPGHEDGFPILITPRTWLQFKIDQMSINQVPPAPPGYTNHYQGLYLYFNNGLILQLTQNGQGILMTPATATWTFDLGLIFVNNIYQMFRDAGITIPEPLYLYKISFSQQLFELQDPSTVEHHQHMEVDFISIVEEKEDEVKPQQ